MGSSPTDGAKGELIMKYIDKFPNMHPIEDEIEGIIRGHHSKPCCMCGKMTEYIDINAEGYICSEECRREFYKEYLSCMKDFD